ncbi:hypothetical protein WAK64_08415 [Bacillus spongiae]|uniref:Transcriptional coactivator p15 (PC4) C-terminal domain-containing protein n=1 Tax=Bacillus spongiae TaxID=2683610 RepID=A0ABU8HD10_9BACI
MVHIIKEIVSPSNQYKVQVIKNNDGIFTTKICMWQKDSGYEFWSPINQGLSLIDTEESAIKIGIEQLREISGEIIN